MRDVHRMSMLLVFVAALTTGAESNAEWLTFKGTHTMRFGDFGSNVEASATGTGVALVNGSGGLGHLTTLELTRNFATLSTVVPITDPIVTAGGPVEIRLGGVRIDPALQGGVFGPVSGALQNTALQLTRGTVPVVGTVRYCLFYAGCNSGSLTQSLVDHTLNGMLEASGIGGLFTIGGEGGIRISMLGAPWTLKTVSYSRRTNNGGLTFPTARGFAHGPASLTSSTAVASSGVVQLVTATQITVVGLPGNQDKKGRISTLSLHFTPEPGLLLLLGAGAVGIAVIGRGRTRR